MSNNDPRSARNIHSTNVALEQNNPCLRESQASLKCLDRNGYDNDKCQDFFANYKACLKFWTKVRRERRWKGIKPELPPLEEREAIRNEYYKK
ncbi:coiled-coil-helix-coiled-coil-helix domain-containing protein 7 [Macrosteles quadrilineatus]|uniref:coiled-coil-helix-coiled-coil-helix domain-containing protein 7 n=1 Tax=Macrosteles quadrilineatus TaxID=74068 RepID=UPI0023E0C842|nr:coiled-coil-helix-coiled-coil-helix domain-containing protein 7 [Macrosteles quadrilineatus]